MKQSQLKKLEIGADNMKKIVLYLFLLVNLLFIVNFLINHQSGFNLIWVIFSIIGIIVSGFFLYKKIPNKLLSFGVLILSISSLGLCGFLYFLTNLMGPQ